MKPSLIVEKLWLILFLAPLVFGIWQSQTWFFATVQFEQSQVHQNAWSDSPETLTVESWQSAGQDLYSAVTQNPNNSEYLHRYGLLLDTERRIAGETLTEVQRQQILTNSIDTHLLGLRQQPSNPYGWAYFVRAKALAGEFDGTFDLALERIYTLGPWEKDIHLTVAGISQFYWPRMSPNGKYYAGNLLQNALSNENYDTSLIQLLEGSEFLATELCPTLDQTSLTILAQEACQSE